jgi:hypothetical protein
MIESDSLYFILSADQEIGGTNLGGRRLERAMQTCNRMPDHHGSSASTLGVMVRLTLLHARQTEVCEPLTPLQAGGLPVSWRCGQKPHMARSDGNRIRGKEGSDLSGGDLRNMYHERGKRRRRDVDGCFHEICGGAFGCGGWC